jgi:hypothetical protein
VFFPKRNRGRHLLVFIALGTICGFVGLAVQQAIDAGQDLIGIVVGVGLFLSAWEVYLRLRVR